MKIERLTTSLRNIFLILLILAQPIFLSALAKPLPARAQDEGGNGEELTDDEDADLTANFQTSADIPPQPADFLPQSFYDLQLFDQAQGRLVIAPEDQQALEEGKIDVRVTDYLIKLVLPEQLGGYNIDHIKVARLQKNYTSDGNGKMDREGADSADEGGGTVSTHNKGQAVDISEVGSVTCKLVYKRHIGGDTTKWQKPKPVKVAWQSTEGINSNPTPTAQSLLGASADMSAQGIVNYLNESGEMDYYIDYVKGMNLKTIVGFIGANIYLKNFGINQVLSDPMADGLLHVLGGAILERSLPGLPSGIAAGNNDDDARVSFAKSRIEQGFGLLPGSLKGYGWDNILQGVGKRHLESSLQLPTNYFENHTLDEALKNVDLKTALNYLGRSDDGLNLMVGTVDKLKAKDERGFKMAGVSILASALKMTEAQKSALETAAVDGHTPNIDLGTIPTGTVISTDDLKGLFSNDPNKQKEVEASFKTIGIGLVRQAAAKAVKGKYAPLTDSILTDLLDSKKTIKLRDVEERAGAGSIGADAGATDLKSGKVDIGAYLSRNATQIANFMNKDLSLERAEHPITDRDIVGLLDSKNFALVEKIGSAQVDKSFGWNNGTTYDVIFGKKDLKTAAQEAMSNFVGTTLGLREQGVSLSGNVSENYGYAILSERLGIDQHALKSNDEIRNLFYGANSIGPSEGYRLFKIFSSKTLTELYSDEGFWEEENNTVNWKAMDIVLGVSLGTTESYIRGQVNTKQFARKVGAANFQNLTVEKIYDHFGIDDRFRLGADEMKNLIGVLSGKDENQTLDNIEAAKTTIYRLLGRSVDGKADFSKDTFFQYIVDPSPEAATNLLLDQGVRLLAQSMGANIDNVSFEDLQYIGDQIVRAFGGKINPESFRRAYGLSLEEAEALRQEYANLLLISPNNLTPEQSARLNELEHHGPLKAYLRMVGNVGDFFMNATGIPIEYRTDAEAFLRGDWRTGIAAMSFALLLPQVNKYLPEDGKLTYKDFRLSLIMDEGDFSVTQLRMDQIAEEQGLTSLTEEQNDQIRSQAESEINASPALKSELRRQALEKQQRHVEYRVADSFLRKADSHIPVGFSEGMFGGNQKIRSELLLNWGFNYLDDIFANASRLYIPGTLKKLYDHTWTGADQDQFILGLISSSNINLGPFNKEFVSNFYQFIRSNNRQDFFTNTRFDGMWSFFDGWMSSTLNIGDLPVGFAKSLYYGIQNNWNFNASLVKDGKTLVQSFNEMGKDFLINRLSEWGDKKFNLPIGTVYKAYKLYTAYSGALKALANGTGSSAAVSNAKNASIMFVIELALSMCSQCQKFFGSVDQALAAPPGFTQAAVVGALAFAMHLGPAGLYIAAAIYLFGVYKVEYLCPEPPKDLFAINTFDTPNDQNDYGVAFDDLPNPVQASPPQPHPSTGDKFQWGQTQHFTNGDNKQLWMGWARYYTGKLLDTTLQYGEARQSPWKPQQLLTYRRANAEFFAPRVVSAFGTGALDIPYVGLGYSQTTTKTTDWVHVSFGGAF